MPSHAHSFSRACLLMLMGPSFQSTLRISKINNNFLIFDVFDVHERGRCNRLSVKLGVMRPVQLSGTKCSSLCSNLLGQKAVRKRVAPTIRPLSCSFHLNHSIPRLQFGLANRTVHQRVMQTSQASSSSYSSAFIEDVVMPGSESGPLAGMTVAVKDLFDMQGHKTGFGHPLWRETHPVASSTAPPVAQLLAAGATVRGRTHLDELAYSLNGENAHYGTPLNPAAPGRVPGGSSSGSAAAVAAGDVDIGLGSDTGGSKKKMAKGELKAFGQKL
ncbi:amidase signature domain-containing protein [Dunaliella salina]|uniref:Amidase signature domain-containing protein n=1 Tax=Dunaliella salina TaxID=3046 RepID=A0ABQ7G9U3_DUNSA|nr:amidase signature domain-containing protein [Dunaliella salina]|eukprot:KAF5831373.1 amidase signature domain-containing protein [Dunaliella salina]